MGRKKMDVNVLAIRKLREVRKVTRKEIADLMGVSIKTIEKFENGRMRYSKEYLGKLLRTLNITEKDFSEFVVGKKYKNQFSRKKIVLENKDRRSYQKIVGGESRALKALRLIRGISQDKASCLCGYARSAIGHIENGRIELPSERIEFIVKKYGFEMKDFYSELQNDFDRKKIIDDCMMVISKMKKDKLMAMHNLISNF